MTQDQKLDEALKETFPASDAFYLSPEDFGPAPERGSLPARKRDAVELRGAGVYRQRRMS
jgi:hypothetical protein